MKNFCGHSSCNAFAALFTALLLVSCSKDDGKPAGPPPTLVTVTKAVSVKLEIAEESVGSLENTIDPKIGAEVAGRVSRLLVAAGQSVKRGQLLAILDPQDLEIQTRADAADVARYQAMFAQQERLVERQTRLVAQGFISKNAIEDASAQRDALKSQLAAAKAKAEGGRSNLSKARVTAPVDGKIVTQMVNIGSYVKVGDAIYQIVGTQELKAHFPYPESASSRIKIGLPVRITSPAAPGKTIEAKIDEIRPTLSDGGRNIDVIVKLQSDDVLRGGGTVNGAIVTASLADAIVVPEQSVVLRPAGRVAYVIKEEGGKDSGKLIAEQRIIETGVRQNGVIQIIKGLQPGETIARDGAAFLTDKAAVVLPKPKSDTPTETRK